MIIDVRIPDKRKRDFFFNVTFQNFTMSGIVTFVRIRDSLRSLGTALRPFLTQSDSASRKRPFSTELFFDWIILALLPRCGRCEGVLLYGSRKWVGSSVLRAFSASNACFALDEPSPQRVRGFGLSRMPPKLRSWGYTQSRAAKAIAAGVAVVGKMGSIPRAAAVV